MGWLPTEELNFWPFPFWQTGIRSNKAEMELLTFRPTPPTHSDFHCVPVSVNVTSISSLNLTKELDDPCGGVRGA